MTKFNLYFIQVGTVASKRLLEMAGVTVRRFVPTQREIVIRFPSVGDASLNGNNSKSEDSSSTASKS